jgi:hypothetical protein
LSSSPPTTDRAITLYDPAEHRPLATRFGQDVGAAILSWKSLAFWLLGYPQAALADGDHALKIAREIGHSATLMYVLNFSAWTHILCGNCAAAKVLVHEFSALKDQTGCSPVAPMRAHSKASRTQQKLTCMCAPRGCRLGETTFIWPVQRAWSEQFVVVDPRQT